MDINAIERTDVLDVLRHLSRDRSPGRSVLVDLEIVRRSLDQDGFEPTPQACEYELGRLLTDVVESNLDRLRALVATRDETPPTATEQMRRDFRHEHRELEAWSAIYHVYLRSDLNLGLADAEALLGDRHRRTIQRRLGQGVDALVAALRDLEREAVRELRRAHATSQLPVRGRRLYGVGSVVAHIEDVLSREGGPAIVALGGPGGIGKTAIAARVARNLVEQGVFDHVAWLAADSGRAPEVASPESLTAALARHGVPGATDGGRPRALDWRRCLVVVDAIDRAEVAAVGVGAHRSVPPPNKILFTGRVGWSAHDDVRAIDVPPLPRPAAVEMLRAEAAARGLAGVARAADRSLAPVIGATAGHPLAIRTAAGQLRTSDAAAVAAGFATGRGAAAALFQQLWGEAWAGAGERARSAVGGVLAARAAGRLADRAAIGAACQLAAEELTAALCAAVDAGLLVAAGGARHRHYRQALFLGRFVRSVGAQP